MSPIYIIVFSKSYIKHREKNVYMMPSTLVINIPEILLYDAKYSSYKYIQNGIQCSVTWSISLFDA